MKELKNMRQSSKKLVSPIIRYVIRHIGEQMLNLMKIENIVSKQQISKGPVDVPVTQEARCFVICEYNI